MPSWSAWMIARTKLRHLLRRATLRHLLERFAPALADTDLAQRELELLDQRAVHVLGQLLHCAVEPQTGLDAHREQIERIRELGRDCSLAAPHASC